MATKREQENELIYLRWLYQHVKHSLGERDELKFMGDMGGRPIPKQYKHTVRVSYVSKGRKK